MTVLRTNLRHRHATRLGLAALGITALTLVAACGTESNPDADGGMTVTETMSATADGETMPTPSPTDAGPSPVGSADTSMKTLRPEAPSQLMVTGVRVASNDGFDRVVFDLTGDGDPGWFIDYTDQPTQQGSGNEISFTGDTALNVNIDGTTYPFELGLEDPQIGTVEGAGGVVTEVVSAGTFEGRSQFVVGLRSGQHAYAVEVLREPHRLVLDIMSS